MKDVTKAQLPFFAKNHDFLVTVHAVRRDGSTVRSFPSLNEARDWYVHISKTQIDLRAIRIELRMANLVRAAWPEIFQYIGLA